MSVFVVRHGSAGSRDDADPDDSDRRLDDLGRSQATWLADLLGDRPVVRIASSPLPRCRETLGPLAVRMGLDVEVSPTLAEGADLEGAWAEVELGCATDGDVVLCSHGDLIPEMIRRAHRRGLHIPGRSGWSKGSVWEITSCGADGVGTWTPAPA